MNLRPAAVRLAPLLLAAILFAAPAAPGLERGPLPANHLPWSALGRVNAGGNSFCTGVLVGPSTALTAAHCLYNFTTKSWWPTRDIHFVAGYLRDGWVATARARRIIREADSNPGSLHPPIDKVSRDWAIIELDAPIGETAGWFPVERRRLALDGTLTLQAGYRRDRPYAPELSPPCRIVEEREKPPLLFHDCVVPEGGSGSPLFVVEGDALRVAGIHSAQVRRDAKAPGTSAKILAAVVPLWRLEASIPAAPERDDHAAEAAKQALSRQIADLIPPQASSLAELMQQVYEVRAR